MASNFVKKQTTTQVFSCKFCEKLDNFFEEHLWATAYGHNHDIV